MFKHLGDYENAKRKASEELDALILFVSNIDDDKANIFNAHKEILDDDIIEKIKTSYLNPDFAIFSVYNNYIDLLGQSEDVLIRERTVDLQDVRNRLIRNLCGIPEKNMSVLSEASIIIAKDLLPSDTATFFVDFQKCACLK